jgi:tetratricopeptide (TPR) repeat protein
MKSVRQVLAILLIVLFAGTILFGCRTSTRLARREPRHEFRQSRLMVMFYLKSLFNRNMWKESYESLTVEFRKQISFSEFTQLVREQVPEALVDPADQDIRIEVNILYWVELSDEETEVYALMSLYYPYEEGSRDSYRVIQLNCRKQKKYWKIQPRFDTLSNMIVLIPTRFFGPLWQYANKRDNIIREITGETRQSIDTPPEKEEITSTPRADFTPEKVEPAPPLTIEAQPEPIAEAPMPDLETVSRPDTDTVIIDELETAILQQVDSLVNVGKLHIDTGEVSRAEEKFLKALELDPDNETVLAYLEYCRKYHEIKGEREAELKLIKAMLNLVGE